MAILLDDEDPTFKALSHAQEAYKHTVALLSAIDVHIPAAVASVVVALKDFHQGKYQEATKAIETYANELKDKGKPIDEQSAKELVQSAVASIVPEV